MLQLTVPLVREHGFMSVKIATIGRRKFMLYLKNQILPEVAVAVPGEDLLVVVLQEVEVAG